MTRDETGSDWRDREAIRRGAMREVNECIASLSLVLAGYDTASIAQFVCECGDVTCTEPIMVALDMYERVRAEPRRYLVVANHEDPETETVIASDGSYAIVETLAGRTSMIAESTDPRRSARLAELNREREGAFRAAEERTG